TLGEDIAHATNPPCGASRLQVCYARLLRIDPAIHSRRPSGMRHDLTHADGVRRRRLALLVPLRRFRHLRVLELVHGRVARFPLDDAIAPGVHYPRHFAIAGNVLTVVPGIPFLIDAVGDGHAPDLERWCHAALRLFDSSRENLLAENACGIFADDCGGNTPTPGT